MQWYNRKETLMAKDGRTLRVDRRLAMTEPADKTRTVAACLLLLLLQSGLALANPIPLTFEDVMKFANPLPLTPVDLMIVPVATIIPLSAEVIVTAVILFFFGMAAGPLFPALVLLNALTYGVLIAPLVRYPVVIYLIMAEIAVVVIETYAIKGLSLIPMLHRSTFTRLKWRHAFLAAAIGNLCSYGLGVVLTESSAHRHALTYRPPRLSMTEPQDWGRPVTLTDGGQESPQAGPGDSSVHVLAPFPPKRHTPISVSSPANTVFDHRYRSKGAAHGVVS